MRAERLNEMEQYILGKETVSLEDLCDQFDISMNTVRRDISELLDRGNIRKVYGGVSSTLINRPVGFSVRKQKNSEAKHVIGQLASKLVSDGSSIFLILCLAKVFRALRSSTKGLAFGIHDLLKKVVENFICPLYFSSLTPSPTPSPPHCSPAYRGS